MKTNAEQHLNDLQMKIDEELIKKHKRSYKTV